MVGPDRVLQSSKEDLRRLIVKMADAARMTTLTRNDLLAPDRPIFITVSLTIAGYDRVYHPLHLVSVFDIQRRRLTFAVYVAACIYGTHGGNRLSRLSLC
jgi:hypothetical protein